MKVCIDAREFVGGRQTGIARHLDHLIRPLLQEPELEWIVFTHHPSDLPATWKGVTTIQLPTAPRPVIDQMVLPWLTVRSGARLFFSPYYKVPLLGRFRRIITIHDIMFLRLPEFPAWKRFLSSVQLRMACARTDRILVDSAYTADDFGNVLPKWQYKTTVLYPSLEASWATTTSLEETASAARNRFADGHPFLLYVGNFKPHKNVKLLIEAFAGLCRMGLAQDYRLLLVGGDPLHRASIEDHCKRSGYHERIRIHTNISDADLRSLYAAAQWTVTLSEYEGFGYPLVEAMARGCPVVCHPCTSLSELARDCVLAVPDLLPDTVQSTLKDAIHMDENQRQAWIAKGRLNAKRFHDGSSSRQFAELIREIGRPS